jgi:hypothetical protein
MALEIKSPERQSNSTFKSTESEIQSGASMSPPAFQLKASPIDRNAAQFKTTDDNQNEYGPDHEFEEELNPGGAFPWDAMVIGGDANLQKTAVSDVAELITTIPAGMLLVVQSQKDGFYRVAFGTQKGFVEQSKLQQLSFRISRNEQLMNVMRGGETLNAGDSGLGINVFQQALSEMSSAKMTQTTGITVNGILDEKTVEILKAFQTETGIGASGSVDQATVSKLNDCLLKTGYSLEGLQLANQSALPNAVEGVEYPIANTPPELLNGTRNISLEEQSGFESAISTESKAVGGVDPVFVETVNGKKYGERIENFLDERIPAMYEYMAEGKQELRNDPNNLHDWGQIEEVAKESKKATDLQFGKYRTGAPLTSQGINAKIKDAWEDKEAKLAADPTVADSWISWRVQKLLDGNSDIKAIDQEHGAIQSRDAEKLIIGPIKTAMMTKYRMELIEIHKGWPAFASAGNVFIQRFKEKDLAGNDDKAKGREYMWHEFQTIIHEYIHTLEHSEHKAYQQSLDPKKGSFTLREGTTDYFTKVAYNNTKRDDATLREKVEGPFHEEGVTHALPNLGTYGESQNAEAAAGIIGFPNMCGAFFLGHTELYRHQ